jgi:hypothetical protein
MTAGRLATDARILFGDEMSGWKRIRGDLKATRECRYIVPSE